MLGRSVTVVAALATTMLALLVPTAGTAVPELDRRALVRELKAAYADELRALGLLSKSPPRIETAKLSLRSSMDRLDEIRGDSSLPTPFKRAINDARGADLYATIELNTNRTSRKAKEFIEKALLAKARALGAMLPPGAPGASQCNDGRDNDGDLVFDAPFDPGCTNAKDGSEGSPLTCSLGYAPSGGAYVVQGTCSGPFFKIEITAPPGAKFDTKRAPVVAHDRVCGLSETRLDCVMGDGMANPSHVVNARWRAKTPQAARSLKVRIIDFAGRGRTSTLSPRPSPPPPPTPFTLGPNPVPVTGTFTNGRGGCPVVTSFTVAGRFFAPGDGALTFTLPGNQVAKGPIDTSGSFKLTNANESYTGKINGNDATAIYTYNASGCLETYDVIFVIQP